MNDTELARLFLKHIQPTRGQIDRFIAGNPSGDPTRSRQHRQYEPALGWIHPPRYCDHGVDGTRVFYHYQSNGARRSSYPEDVPCRLQAHGPSFTHGAQVNDFETWPEQLAARLGEPIANFGIGSYSVLQTFLRLKKTLAAHPATHVIFNVSLEGHNRNIEPITSLRGAKPNVSARPSYHVDEKAGLVDTLRPCLTKEELYRLLDLDFMLEQFGDEIMLKYILSVARETGNDLSRLSNTVHLQRRSNPSDETRFYMRIIRENGIKATMLVLNQVEAYAKENDIRLFLLLTHTGKTPLNRGGDVT